MEHRNNKGTFSTRQQLREVTGLGPKTFEQAAGFLRIRGGATPLDGSAVHPERYSLVQKMAEDLRVDMQKLVGDSALVGKIEWKKYMTADVGEPTLRDILDELKKPGRDPRQSFEPPAFRDDVNSMEDLQPGMWLEGVVTNVTAFGAFIDVGVHQDGLAHVSQLADRFIKDPSEVVKAGDKIKVRVLEVDMVRKRIALTARTGEGPTQGASGKPAPSSPGGGGRREGGRPSSAGASSNNSSSSSAGGKFTNNPFANLTLKR